MVLVDPKEAHFHLLCHSPTKSFKGRYFEGKDGIPVGAGVDEARGGDACVALEGGRRQLWEQDEGDATAQGVPTPLHPSPAPTGTKPLEATSPNTYP